MTIRLSRPSLRWRIIAWSFIPTTVILFAIALFLFYAYQRVTEDLVVGRNEELTRRAAGQLSSDLAIYAETLSSLARSADIYSGDPMRQSAALKPAASRLVMFDGGLVILDQLGHVVVTEPERPDWLGHDWSGLSFFQQMMHTNGPAYSDILPGSPPMICVAVPILGDQGEFRGTLAGLFQLGPRSVSAFYGDIVKLRIGDGGSTYLVDSTGRVIFHSDDSLIGSDAHSLPEVQQVIRRQTGDLRTRGGDGSDLLATFAPVAGTPWGLVSEQAMSELLAASQGYGPYLIVLLALGLVVPSLVVALGVKRITDPIHELIGAAKEIAGGKFGQVIEVHSGDELEELARQFNLMSKQLSESYTQLEQRVEARTRELASLNAISAVVSRSLDLSEVLSAALDEAMAITRMEVGAAYNLQDGDTPIEDRQLVLAASRGLPDAFFRRIGPRPVGGTTVQNPPAAQQPTAWRIGDYPDGEVKEALEAEGVRQVISVPLLAKGTLVGAMSLGTRHEEQPLSPEELSLLAAIGQQIAVAAENARLYDQAEQSAAAAERQRLSRELHDSVTQSLYGVTMYAEAAARLLDAGNTTTAIAHLRELRDTAQEALREMRLLIFELRPLALEKIGLAAALQARLESVEMRGGMTTELSVEGEEDSEHLPRLIEEELYHIAQEALNNALKHAHAQHLALRLRFSEAETLLEVCDDGVGFVPSASGAGGGLGLASLKERAQKIGAKLSIESAPGSGTQIQVTAPAGKRAEDAG
ncbi:MAG TPA: cache domain-containing protein [Candidatus Edwardsbacteria bacterium]|nr:cache domain-containing protein [Candidatus Edwardsbacteria bacterium]